MIFRSSGLRCILLLFVIICLYALVATAHGTLKQCPNPVTGDDDTTQTDDKLTDDDYGNSCMCFFIYVLSVCVCVCLRVYVYVWMDRWMDVWIHYA